MYVFTVRVKHGSPTGGNSDWRSIRQIRNRPSDWVIIWKNDFVFAFVFECKFSTQIVNLRFPYYRASVWISVLNTKVFNILPVFST